MLRHKDIILSIALCCIVNDKFYLWKAKYMNNINNQKINKKHLSISYENPSNNASYFNTEKESQQDSNPKDTNLFLGGKRKRAARDDNDSIKGNIKDNAKLSHDDTPNDVEDNVKNHDIKNHFFNIVENINNESIEFLEKDSKVDLTSFIKQDKNDDENINSIKQIIMPNPVLDIYSEDKELVKRAKETLIKLGAPIINTNMLINKINHAISKLSLQNDESKSIQFRKRLSDILSVEEIISSEQLKSNCIREFNKFFSISAFSSELTDDKSLKLNLIGLPVEDIIIDEKMLKQAIYELDLLGFKYENGNLFEDLSNKFAKTVDMFSIFKIIGMSSSEIYHIVDNLKKVQLIIDKIAKRVVLHKSKSNNLLSYQLYQKLRHDYKDIAQEMYNRFMQLEIKGEFNIQKERLQKHIYSKIYVILNDIRNICSKIYAAKVNYNQKNYIPSEFLPYEKMIYIKKEIDNLASMAISLEYNGGDYDLKMNMIPMMQFRINELLLQLDEFKMNRVAFNVQDLKTKLSNLSEKLGNADKSKITNDIYIKYTKEFSKINSAVRLYNIVPQIAEINNKINDATKQIGQLNEYLNTNQLGK
jgi:hypothetical protein